MWRHIDKLVLLIGIVMLAALVLYQSFVMVGLKVNVADELEKAAKLADQANKNHIEAPPRNPADFSGKVFAAWEHLPIMDTMFYTADFFPGPAVGR